MYVFKKTFQMYFKQYFQYHKTSQIFQSSKYVYITLGKKCLLCSQIKHVKPLWNPIEYLVKFKNILSNHYFLIVHRMLLRNANSYMTVLLLLLLLLLQWHLEHRSGTAVLYNSISWISLSALVILMICPISLCSFFCL